MAVPPLDGITVLEVGVFMAAPYATMQFADLGARVVKVEPADGDPTRASGPVLEQGRSSPFVRLNRGKESVVLDLKSPGGREAFLRLAGAADVVVENLRPGALRRLGLDGEALRAVHPHLVCASGSGFGQDGPLAGLPGLDIMAQARAGLMSITGPPGGEPAKVGVPVCDLVCGLYLALAVLAALHERARTGLGQSIDVSLLESGVSLAVWEAGRWFATGEVPQRLGSAHQSQAPYQAVRTADGWATLGAITPKTWAGLCRALDLPDLLADPAYATSSGRHAAREQVVARVEAATAARTTEEVVAALEAEGVPCAPIADFDAVFTDEHLAARDFFWDAEHPALGPLRQLGSPMRFSRTPTVRGAAGPDLGSGTRAALLAVGYTPEEVDALHASGAAGLPA